MHDELLDVVNEHDHVIGAIYRSQLPKTFVNTRIVLTFIINHEGKLAILRRSPQKEISPLHLALIGGCVQSGETYEQALKRETAEEANIIVDHHEYRLLGIHKPHEGWKATYGGLFKAIYEIKIHGHAIEFNREDFCELLWLSPQEIVACKETDKIANGLLWLVEKYYF
jgi:8-oxo-dGTP pyrophosphatase MutT (NUDIX family)